MKALVQKPELRQQRAANAMEQARYDVFDRACLAKW